jgi:integrase
MNHLADSGIHMMASKDKYYPTTSSRRNYMLQWSVTPKTAIRYQQHVKEFLTYCIIQEQEDFTDEQEFDDLLLDYIHHLYESGRGKSKASMTLYGIINVLPNLNGKLPKSAQAVRGWNKQVPGRSYPPLTWELAVTIAVQMCRSGHYQYGVGVLLAFDCFLRVSELCGITKDNIADTGDHRIGVEHKGTLISLPTTKTGKNLWVEIRDPSVLTLVRPLVKHLALSMPLHSVDYFMLHVMILVYPHYMSLILYDMAELPDINTSFNSLLRTLWPVVVGLPAHRHDDIFSQV